MGKRSRNKRIDAEPDQGRGTPWPELQPHQPVSLVDGQGARVAGTLDEITADRSTIWIQLDGGMGRQLIHQLDGYELDGYGPEADAAGR